MAIDLSGFWAEARAWALASDRSGVVTIEQRVLNQSDKNVLRIPLNSQLVDEAKSFDRPDWLMALEGIDDGLTEGAGLGDVDEPTAEVFCEIAQAIVERWISTASPGRYRVRARENRTGKGPSASFQVEAATTPPTAMAEAPEQQRAVGDDYNMVLAFNREQRRHVNEALGTSTSFARNMEEIASQAIRGTLSDTQAVYRAMINDMRVEHEGQLRQRDAEAEKYRARIDTLEAQVLRLETDNRQTVAGSIEKVIELKGEAREAAAHASNVREFGQTLRQAMDGAMDLGAVYLLKDKGLSVEEMGYVRLLSRSPELLAMLRMPWVKKLLDDPRFREILENDAARAQMLEAFQSMANSAPTAEAA